MKGFAKIFAVCAMVALVCLSFMGCAASYSGDTIKNNLTNAGYIVSESFDLKFEDDTKASELKGIQKIYAVAKGNDADKELSIILVFDSIQNADDGITDQRLLAIYDEAKYQCGSNKKDSIVMGRYNNVTFVGPQSCKDASGIR